MKKAAQQQGRERVRFSGRARRLAAGWIIAMLLLAGVERIFAQGSGASIIGTVRDESGAVLPGVSVTAKSGALQVAQVTAVTDERGEYRLTTLPVGSYEVRYELSGFQTIDRTGVRLTTGFVATIDISMKVGNLAESVTVSGASPVVDVTTTSTTTTLVREALEELPTTRNSLVSLAVQTPGIRTSAGGFDVGGSLFTGGTQLNSFGRNGDNWLMLDGVLTTAAAGSTEGVYWDFSTYEEAVVKTAGGDAEVPSSGVYMNTILKSGGNDFHGTAFYGITGPKLQSTNIDEELRARGVAGTNKLIERYDFSGDLGGRIIRDKLWFYGNFRRAFDDAQVINVFKPDGSPGNFPRLQRFWTVKASYQLTPNQRLVAMQQWNGKYNVRSTINTGWESRVIQDQVGNTRKGEWSGTFGDSVSATGMFGYWNYDSPLYGAAPGKVGSYDIGTLRYGGDEFWLAGPAPVNVTQHRYQSKATLTWYKRNIGPGNHEFKTGFDYSPSTYNNIYHPRGDSGDYYLIFRNLTPFQIGTWNIPVSPISRADYTGVFAQDNWMLGAVTLNLGLRYDRNNGYNPEQSRNDGTFATAQTFPKVQYPVWNGLAPRIHAAWNIAGGGGTALKGGWSRYSKMRFIGDVTPSNLNWLTTNLYTWRDLNGDRAFQSGESIIDPNGPDFVSSENPPGITALPNGGGTGIPNPDESGPKIDEFNASFEHELIPDLAVRVTGVFTREFNLRRLSGVSRPYSSYNIPISRPDPGPDGISNNTDDTGQTLTYWEYDPSLRGKAFAVTTPVNDPDFINLNRAIEFSMVKRSSGGWQMLGAVGRIWPSRDFAADLAPLTPNAEILPRDEAPRWYVKLGGSYRLRRWDVLMAANFNATSGEPFARTVLVTGGNTIPSLALPAEQFGARQYDNAYLFDIRAEKSLRFGGHRLSIRGDLFNAFNSNVVIAQTIQSGVNFLRPTTILPARIAVFSFSYSF